MNTDTYLSLQEIINRTKLPKKSLLRLYRLRDVRTLKGPGRSKRFHVADVRKQLNGHGHLLDQIPAPEPIALVAYEVAGVRLGLRSKEEAFDRIAALVPSKISLG